MRISAVLGFGMALITSAVLAQQPKAYQPRKSYLGDKKSASAAPLPKAPSATTNANRDLRHIEQQTAKTPTGVRASGPKHRSGSAPLLKSSPSQPINAAPGGGMGTNTKSAMLTNHGKDPYKGRLRQKGGR
jgi:hypothetical protein